MNIPTKYTLNLRPSKRLLLGASLALLLGNAAVHAVELPAVLQPPPVTAKVMQVMATRVELRSDPDAKSTPLALVGRGNLLEVIESRANWYHVRYGTRPADMGWVQRLPDRYDQYSVEFVGVPSSPRYANEQTGTGDSKAPIDAARPGDSPRKVVTLPPIDPRQVMPPMANLPRESLPIPDRWRIMQALNFKFPWYDPYNQNVYKGDLPVRELGHETFLSVIAVSDTLFEARSVPTPVSQTTSFPDANDIFGGEEQEIFATTVLAGFSIVKGDTTFRPPDYEFRALAAINYNRVNVEEAGALRIDPLLGRTREDNFAGLQELFYDKHLRNVSDRYDFDSVRVGIQPFTSDFRGFLFIDQPVGVRLFGNRANNRYQYNLAWFRRIEKNTNSGLNDIFKDLREDDVFVANLYMQDTPILGFTSQVSITHDRNDESGDHYDTNGFLVRPALVGDGQPHDYSVTYLGYSGDGNLLALWPKLRLNLTTSTYLAVGNDSHNPIAGRAQTIFAGFHASELSRDFDWIRVRGNLLFASGDGDPYDGEANGFDAISEAPQFAGADTAYFIRQGIPLIGGGGVALSGRNGILQSLRSSKDQGQSNFVNPGLQLYGVGADFDVLPTLRVTTNVSYLRFMDTAVLGALRLQSNPDEELGTDFAVGFQYRPFYNQNFVLNASASVLHLGQGMIDLYGEGYENLYSTFVNAIIAY